MSRMTAPRLGHHPQREDECMPRRRAERVGRPRRRDAGFVTAWTVALAVACWSLVGLALDGGRALRARSEAFGAAASAARAGAQAIDTRAVLMGDVRFDEAAARQAALDYVADRGFEGGSVEIDEAALEVTVTIRDRTDLYILPIASVGYTVSATARAVQGAPVT